MRKFKPMLKKLSKILIEGPIIAIYLRCFAEKFLGRILEKLGLGKNLNHKRHSFKFTYTPFVSSSNVLVDH